MKGQVKSMGLKKCNMNNLHSLEPDAKQGNLLIIQLKLYELEKSWSGSEVSDECREQVLLKKSERGGSIEPLPAGF